MHDIAADLAYSYSFFGLEGATLAGLERSDWENRMKRCITAVTNNKPSAAMAAPFHVDSNADHLKNLNVANNRRHAQDNTTCFRVKQRS